MRAAVGPLVSITEALAHEISGPLREPTYEGRMGGLGLGYFRERACFQHERMSTQCGLSITQLRSTVWLQCSPEGLREARIFLEQPPLIESRLGATSLLIMLHRYLLHGSQLISV